MATLVEWVGTWDEWREEIEDIRSLEGDRVMVSSSESGRGKDSGIKWENRFVVLYEVKAGLITRWTVYDDPAKALEAAGLR